MKGRCPINKFSPYVAAVASLINALGLWHLFNMAKGSVAISSHNWTTALIEVIVGSIGLSVAYGMSIRNRINVTMTSSAEGETVEQLLSRVEQRARQDVARKITGGIIAVMCCFFLAGCMEPVSPTPIDKSTPNQKGVVLQGLAATVHDSLILERSQIQQLAAQLSTQMLDDSTNRKTWNENYGVIVTKAATSIQEAVKAALEAAPSPEAKRAVWVEIAKGYSP